MIDNNSCAPPTKSQRWLRSVGRDLAEFIFPSRIYDEYLGLEGATHLLGDGYGLIVLMNHFSTRDAAQVLALVLKSDVISSRPIVAPVAHHQHNSLVQFWTEKMAIKLCPIVTKGTIRRLGSDYRLGDGLVAYAEAAIQCLRVGGIILLAPQGGRRSTLNEPIGRPLGNLLAQAKRHHLDRVAFLFIGLGVPGLTDYSPENIGGANFGKLYEVRIGRAVRAEEAIHHAGGRRKVDNWAFGYLRRLVPEAYAGDVSARCETPVDLLKSEQG